jgi:AraC-like DNA-binding protein
MKWITRERPKIDRIACPWLIKRFIDTDAEIFYAPFDKIEDKARELNAILFDVPGAEYSHYQDRCTFDYFLKKHKLNQPALHRMAAIIRGADTDRHDLAAQSAGLEAIFAGLAYNIKNDNELVELGMIIYDGLYAWATHLYKQKHTQTEPAEKLLLQVYNQFLKQQKGKKSPAWAKELRNLIQDQIDTNMSLSLQQVANELDINSSYISREFSKYFDSPTFGEHIRKLRIEKAVNLMNSTSVSLTEIAYLTGFSDQSHFNRIFKKYMGCSPSVYKKSTSKRKTDTIS